MMNDDAKPIFHCRGTFIDSIIQLDLDYHVLFDLLSFILKNLRQHNNDTSYKYAALYAT